MEKGKLSLSEVTFWLAEARSCTDRQKTDLIQKNHYPFLVNYFEGIQQVDAVHPHVSAQTKYLIINEYFPNTNSLISEIMYQNPDMLLEALKPQAEEDLPLMKSALSYFWDKAEGLIENRVALFDMLFAGYCAVEVDIIPKPEREKAEPEPMAEPEPGRRSVFDQFMKGVKNAMNPEEAENNLAKLSPPMESNFATAQGTYIRRYDPMDVPLDWRAERVKDRRYNLKKVWMSKAEFDAKYPAFKDKVQASDDKFEFARHGREMHNRKVLLYEFQVRFKGEKYMTVIVSPYVLTREIDSFIRPYTTNGFNMKIGTLHKYGKLYPVSFAQVNKYMQDEMNHYVRHLMEVAERNIPKYLIDDAKVKEDGIVGLESNRVNALVPVKGNTSGAVTPLQPTTASFENKELLAIFQDQKNKLWSVSESRISGKAPAKFATDIAVQEQAFQARQVDVQEGLRFLIQEQLNTGKDLIVSFWDDEVFLKVTGHPKMKWYEPMTAPNPNNPNESMVLNPLTEMLTADYDVKIDIASALRPNRKDQLSNMFFFMTQLVQIRPILNAQGKDINTEEIKRVSKEFGWDPEKLLVEYQPQLAPTVPTAGGETISPEEDAARQAEAEGQVNAAP